MCTVVLMITIHVVLSLETCFRPDFGDRIMNCSEVFAQSVLNQNDLNRTMNIRKFCHSAGPGSDMGACIVRTGCFSQKFSQKKTLVRCLKNVYNIICSCAKGAGDRGDEQEKVSDDHYHIGVRSRWRGGRKFFVRRFCAVPHSLLFSLDMCKQ